MGRVLSWILLGLGAPGLVFAATAGQLEVHLILVIPVVSASGPLAALSALAAMAGLFGLFWTTLAPLRPPDRTSRKPRDARQREAGGHAREGQEQRGEPVADRESSTRGWGVILLGPIPIGWGSDRETLAWLVAGAIVSMLVVAGWTLWIRP